jgi:hypothetical protein
MVTNLNQQLLDAGVNLTDMAKESHFNGESYGNLYEVLRKERLGLEIKNPAQVRRLELLRQYLANVLDGTVSVRAEEPEYDDDGRLVEVGEQRWIQRAQTTPVPRGLVRIDHAVRLKGVLCGPGVVISLTMQHGPLEPGNYMFLRALARPEEPDTPVEIELYGGQGYLRAKPDPKTGLDRWFAKHRTVRPDVFRRGRPPVPRPTPDSEYLPATAAVQDEQDDGDDGED